MTAEPRPSAPKKAKRTAKPRAPRARVDKPTPPRPKARKNERVGGATALPRRGVLVALGVVLTLGLVVGGLFFAARYLATDEGAGPVVVDWPAGLGPEDAAAELAGLGLVDNEAAMALYLRATGADARFVPGPHLLRGGRPAELVALLTRDDTRPTVKVTLPEGFHRFDVAARLEKNGVAPRDAFLAATTDPALLAELGLERATSAEGFLFPATYELYLDAEPAAVVRRLVGEMRSRWDALTRAAGGTGLAFAAEQGWGRTELVTLASIVEKEAVVDDERPLIASVFWNRMRDPSFRPKRLQSDPTAAYGCVAEPSRAPSCASYAGKPTPAINHDAANRYSTYTQSGLPPGPIANPGEASLRAVLAPASTRYFYFVAKGGGRHTFSETLGAHNDAIRRSRDD